MADMRCHDSTGIDHRITHVLRLIAHRGLYPHCRQAKGGIARYCARQLSADIARIDGQKQIGEGFAIANLCTLEGNAIRIWAQFQVIAYMHRRRQEADILGEFFTYAFYTPQQIAILLLVDQGDHAVTHFQSQHIHLRHVLPTCFSRLNHRHRGEINRHYNLFCFGCFFDQVISEATHNGSQKQESKMRHAGYHAHGGDNHGGKNNDRRLVKQLLHQLLTDVLFTCDTAHD